MIATAPKPTCHGLTFFPVPEFDALTAAFGAPLEAFFDRRKCPDVPREYETAVSMLFYSGGEIPKFSAQVDRKKAAIALRAWLSSFQPAHEAKIATAAYAVWLWSTMPDEPTETRP